MIKVKKKNINDVFFLPNILRFKYFFYPQLCHILKFYLVNLRFLAIPIECFGKTNFRFTRVNRSFSVQGVNDDQ